MDKTKGLTCPECNGNVPIKEGVRFVTCPYCRQQSLLQGDHGVRRWQVSRRVERDQAERCVQGFFTGFNKASDLKKNARLKEMFLVYLPYWRLQADVGGWIFGREKKDKDSTRPVEVEILEQMHWNDAALDVSEYGVHQVKLNKNQLEPFDSETLHAEALVYEPTESATDARSEAQTYFKQLAGSKRKLKSKSFEQFHFFHEHFSIVYYPLWVARYAYRQRQYQVIVDGVNGDVLYGKAPGNILYRAAALVGGLAAGNFLLVNGTIIAGRLLMESSSGDDAGLIIILPAAIGIGLIIAGYRAFRFGEEVEQIDGKVHKAISGKGRARTWLDNIRDPDEVSLENLLETGMKFLDET